MNRASRPAEPRAAFVHPLQLIERPDPPRVAPGDDGQAGITAGTCCLQVLLNWRIYILDAALHPRYVKGMRNRLVRARGCQFKGANVLNPVRAKPNGLMDRFRGPLQGMPFMPVLRAYGGLRPREAISQTELTLGRIGSLEVRLARSAAEVRRAQKLRYRVFYKEMGAVPDAGKVIAQRDVDPFDAISDHLIVLDHASWGPTGKPALVGTYRLLRQQIAERSGGFYSAGEFDIAPLLARHRDIEFLELGRSCVLPAYRTKRTVELLWQGIWTYVLHHGLDAMIGCASLEGTDPCELALPLSFLNHFAPAPEQWRVRALPNRYVEMNRISREHVDKKAAVHALPPLLKGYLRLGAFIGEGAVIDYQFGTTDVLIILPVFAISARYKRYFDPTAHQHSA